MRRAVYILLLGMLNLCAFAQEPDRTAEDFVRAGVIIAEPGDVLYSTIGHAALHMQCEAYGLDYVFSYEGEDVQQKILTFLQGKLRMGMFAIPTEMFVDGYRKEGRGVWEYRLNLSPEQKQELWRALDERTAAGADLPYDYFHRGCAITIVELLHEALGDTPIVYAPWTDKYTKKSRRELVRDAITDAPWNEWVLYMLIGEIGDRKCTEEEKLIVPADLVETLQKATVSGQRSAVSVQQSAISGSPRGEQSAISGSPRGELSAVSGQLSAVAQGASGQLSAVAQGASGQLSAVSSQPLLATEPITLVEPLDLGMGAPEWLIGARRAKWGITPMAVGILLLILAIAAFAAKRYGKQRGLRIAATAADYTVLATAWAMGIAMTYLVVVSSLPCTEWNWLLIPFNILPMLAWHWRMYWALPYAGIIAVWAVVMAVWPHVLVDPAQIVLATAYAIALAPHGTKIEKQKVQ